MFSDLKSSLFGEIYFDNSITDEAIKRVYATDASEYQEKPQAVIIPKTVEDIVKTIQFAQKNKLTVVPRAAGTSLAGQVVSDGIIVDISKHFIQIIELNQGEKWVKVQPGVIRDDLNAYLKPIGLMFGPETSTANRAMIGGMIGNNSCGLHSIIWGTTRDNLLEVKAILSDGNEVIFKDLNQFEYHEKLLLPNKEGDIYRKIDVLINNQANEEAIRKDFPKKEIKRRNTGYALDFLIDMVLGQAQTPFNLSTLMAGSEGTLCFITEAKLRLINLPYTHMVMVAVHTNTLNEALQANLVALNHQCAASELVDDFILEFTKTNTEQAKNCFFIEGEPKAILIVEFFATSETELLNYCERFKKQKIGLCPPYTLGRRFQKSMGSSQGRVRFIKKFTWRCKTCKFNRRLCR
jgi:FAD/FMN-containing dehydrogenase